MAFPQEVTETYINDNLILKGIMEITISKDTKKELAFEAEGLGHTFCALLKEAL